MPIKKSIIVRTGVKAAIALGVSTVALSTVEPSMAQSSDGDDSVKTLDTVIVSARKTDENLQEVPLSITALSAETLERAGVVDLAGVAAITPGLTFQHLGSGRNNLPTIRGLAQTNLFAAENNVGTFLNGIYLSNKSGIDLQLVDISRIEVIKGPQSALFGRSSFAGAINFVTPEPSETFSARLTTSIGTDEWLEGRMVVEGPISESISGRLSIGGRSFDGTFENRSAPNDNAQGFDASAVNAQLQAELTPSTTLNMFAYYGEDQRDQGAEVLLVNNCGGTVVPTYFCGDLPSFDEVDLTPGAFGLQRETSLAALTVDHDFSENLKLTSITSISETTTSSLTDFDFVGEGVSLGLLSGGTLITNTFNSEGDLSTEEWSQEFRLDWTTDRLRLLVGAFYFNGDERTETVAAVDSTNLPAGDNFASFFGRFVATDDPFNAPVQIVDRTTTTETFAVFGLAEYQFTDQLSGSVELRHETNEKDIVRPNSLGRPAASDSAEFASTTPRFTLQYDANENLMVYGSAAQGARSGGFNGLFSPLFPDESTFDDEVNWTYELGVKTTFNNGAGLFNTAVFHTDWTDLQIQSASQDPTSFAQPVRNVAGAESTGFEIEFGYAFANGFSFNGGYAYADPTFKDGTVDLGVGSSCGGNTTICVFDAAGRPVVEGNQLGRTHKHQFNASAIYEFAVRDNWEGYIRTDISHLSEQPSRSINVQFVPERTVANARIGVQSQNVEIALWARNLFDERYATSQNRQPRFHTGTSTNTIQGDGRVIGVTSTFTF